jgi:hypothetical protein
MKDALQYIARKLFPAFEIATVLYTAGMAHYIAHSIAFELYYEITLLIEHSTVPGGNDRG